VKVTSRDGGTAVATAEVTIQHGAGPALPQAPTDVTASATPDGNVTVTWKPPAGSVPVAGYAVRNDDPPFTGLVPADDTGSFTVTGLAPGTSITFEVAAIGDEGTGPAATSNPVTIQGGSSTTSPTSTTTTTAPSSTTHPSSTSGTPTTDDRHNPPGGSLPRTGQATWDLAVKGIALVLLGLLMAIPAALWRAGSSTVALTQPPPSHDHGTLESMDPSTGD
jgi:hypothetical protein